MKRLTYLSLVALLLASAAQAQADIFQWEYINPADPGQGKQRSNTLTVDGFGLLAEPGLVASSKNLTKAYLIGADLTAANFTSANLTNADISQANLTNANFLNGTLTAANLDEAEVRGAGLGRYAVSFYDCTRFVFLQGCVQYGWFTYVTGTGITPEQLYSTASYNAHDLTGIQLEHNILSGVNLASQNLTNAKLPYATLNNANLSQANLSDGNFYAANLTNSNLSHAILANANLAGANLTGANLTGADVRGARVGWGTDSFEGWICENPSVGGCLNWDWGAVSRSTPGGINLAQLSTTASYQARDLSGIDLTSINLADADFTHINLTNASFDRATLTGAIFTDAEVRGVNFAKTFGGTGITSAQLSSTASYRARNLTGIKLTSHTLAGWNFAGQNLSSADLSLATLTDADFAGAEVRGADFWGSALTLTQLYSTASYLARDMSGIVAAGADFTGANFTRQNLTGANFNSTKLVAADLSQANLTDADFIYANLGGANFEGADTRGAQYLNLNDAVTTNLIGIDGRINGLVLSAGQALVVRDYDGNPALDPDGPPIPLRVLQRLVMAPGGALRMVLESDAWDSTISYSPGIPVTLGGTLDLEFAAGIDVAGQVGRTFDIFDWANVSPTGQFQVASPYAWDLTNLYTTGEVTLVGVPEPPTVVIAAVGLLVMVIRSRWAGSPCGPSAPTAPPASSVPTASPCKSQATSP